MTDDSQMDSAANGGGEDRNAEPEEGTQPSAGAVEAAEAQEPADPLAEAQAEASRYREQLLRTAADFDNFRKRSRRELADAAQRGAHDLLRDVLPIFDNLERATSHAASATDVQSLVSGIEMVMKQFHDVLGRLGIERVPGEGSPFDPAMHEAIQHVETADHPAGAVAQVVQGGYRMGERLIRPAMVVVSKGSPRAAGETPAEEAANDMEEESSS